MTNKKTDKKKIESVIKLDSKIERVMARHDFGGTELIELGKLAGRKQGERDSLESNLSSIKKDFQSRIETAENERDAAFRKLTDGFEMQEVEGIIDYNTPLRGQKTIWLHLGGDEPRGEVIEIKEMTSGDLQMEIDLVNLANESKNDAPINPVEEAWPQA